MLDWHPYDSGCTCEPCKVRTLALQERPDRAPVDDPIGEIMAQAHQPLLDAALSNMLTTRARGLVTLSPDQAAAALAAYQLVAIEAIGNTPASRAASDEDTRAWVKQQLSLVAETRAQLRLERAKSLNLRQTIEHIHALLNEGEYDGAEAALLNAVDGFADDQVDEALTSAGEAAPRG